VALLELLARAAPARVVAPGLVIGAALLDYGRGRLSVAGVRLPENVGDVRSAGGGRGCDRLRA
jgi:hypothetical protein